MLIISNMKTKFINQPFSKRAMMVLAVLFTTLTAGATQFITDVMVIGGSKDVVEELKTTYKAQGWTLVNNDLNAGCGSSSDFIYLLYKSEENTDGFNHGYITDFYIYGSENGIFEEKITYQDRTYYLVPFDGSSVFKKSKGDLNRGAGGPYIHLYYTMDPQSDKAVSVITFDNMQFNALGNMGLSGGISGYNLNAGCSSGENIYMHITTNNATTQTFKYIKYTYDTTNGLTKTEKSCSGYHTVTSSTNTFNNGWYVLSSSQSFDDRITVSGTVNLILCDGCTLEAKKGLALYYGNTLNIFAQSEGANTGQLKAIATDNFFFSGIGGGKYSDGGTVTIYGGMVEAYGGFGAAGIGVGYSAVGCEVIIYGGTVEAHGGSDAAGIGGGAYGSGGEVIIYGGTVEAHSESGAAGIGAGYFDESHGTLKIGDGVKVYGGNSANPTTLIATGPKDNVESRPCYMIVGGHVKGDANDDLKVNAADLVEMVNAKNDKASTRFVLKNADIDGDKKITQSDIDAVVKIIMKK